MVIIISCHDPFESLSLCYHRVQDMANEFPHVSFYGLEIGESLDDLDCEIRSDDNFLVPIVPNENLSENVQFEIHDIGKQTRLGDASVDMVHARSVFMAVSHHMAFR